MGPPIVNTVVSSIKSPGLTLKMADLFLPKEIDALWRGSYKYLEPFQSIYKLSYYFRIRTGYYFEDKKVAMPGLTKKGLMSFFKTVVYLLIRRITTPNM